MFWWALTCSSIFRSRLSFFLIHFFFFFSLRLQRKIHYIKCHYLECCARGYLKQELWETLFTYILRKTLTFSPFLPLLFLCERSNLNPSPNMKWRIQLLLSAVNRHILRKWVTKEERNDYEPWKLEQETNEKKSNVNTKWLCESAFDCSARWCSAHRQIDGKEAAVEEEWAERKEKKFHHHLSSLLKNEISQWFFFPIFIRRFHFCASPLEVNKKPSTSSNKVFALSFPVPTLHRGRNLEPERKREKKNLFCAKKLS